MDAPLRSVEKRDVDVAEVMLRELAGEPFESHDRAKPLRAQLLHEPVERALPAVIALATRSTVQLQGHHVGLLGELGDEEIPERLRLRRTTDLAAPPLGGRVEAFHPTRSTVRLATPVGRATSASP